MTEADLVQQFLAKGGQVTKCPPQTFSTNAWETVSWREQFIQARNRAARARRMSKVTAESVVTVQPKVRPAARPKPAPRKATAVRGPVINLDASEVVALLSEKAQREAAAELGVSRTTLVRFIRAKQLVVHRRKGNPIGLTTAAHRIEVLGYQWRNLPALAADLGISKHTLREWVSPSATQKSKNKLHAAVEAWANQNERIAA